ncbi:MAG: S8 family serine peptidase, partial [Aquincola sp.]|nr:S8 family serine peptidase [Aquincola sp.]
MKTLKVFAPKSEQAKITALGRAIEAYEAFVVVAVDDTAARKLLRRYPCEDMSQQYQLRIGGIDIDPLSDAARSRPEPPPVDDAPHHYLVQFVGPIKPAWLTTLRKAGGAVRSPVGGFAYIVRADGAAIARIRALPWVRWAGHLRHEDRIATVLKSDEPPAAVRSRGRAMGQVVTLEVFDAADLERVAAEAQRHGFEVLAGNKRARRIDLKVPDEGAMKLLVARLAEVHGVARIAPRSVPRTCNNVASYIVGRHVAAAPPPGLGLTGEGEIVAVCDTGLDTGRLDQLHPDFDGRVLAIKSYPIARGYAGFVRNPGANDGADDVDAGHGTHVAGSILGNGRASAGAAVRIEGMAPRAQLVFQAVEQKVNWKPTFDDDPFQLAGLPEDLASLFEFAYRKGARIHNNSWSGGTPGVYDASCRQIDRFVWDHRDFAIFVAAGNDGSDTGGAGKPPDGRINPKSVTPPGTAKNCITVGACES